MLSKYLSDLLHQNPFLTSLDLSNRGLSAFPDLHSLLLIAKFSELRRVDLSENHIKNLNISGTTHREEGEMVLRQSMG